MSLLLSGCQESGKSKTDIIDITNPVKTATAANDINAELIATHEHEHKDQLAQNTKTIGTELKVIGKTYTAQSKELVAANKKIDKLSDSKYTAVSILCLVLVGIGIILMVNGRLKIGMSISAGAMGTLISTYAINALMTYMWLVGLCMAVIVIGAFGYVTYLQFIKNRTIQELISTVQVVKPVDVSPEIKRQVDTIQSQETKAAVKLQKEN